VGVAVGTGVGVGVVGVVTLPVVETVGEGEWTVVAEQAASHVEMHTAAAARVARVLCPLVGNGAWPPRAP
jgi:hypothetical protein